MLPTGQNTTRAWRMYALAGLAVVLLLVIWLPQTDLPGKSTKAIGSAWHKVTGGEGSKNDATEQKEEDEIDWKHWHPEEVKGADGLTVIDGAPLNETGFDFHKWGFQFDLDQYELPEFNVALYKDYPAHNYRGPNREVFATYFATHSPSLYDPYFMATQQVVYRLLWDPWSRSPKHPVVVFVAPFVTQMQRDILTAQGALVRELDIVPFHPKPSENGGGVNGRLLNMFSKLEMWKQIDFSRIAYMDSDAFPITNVDAIFDLAPQQRCKVDRLFAVDLPRGREMCDYVFAGHVEETGQINAGVLVLKPNLAMHDMLIRESKNLSNFDQGFAEQAFVNYIYRADGPFPPTTLPAAYNGWPDLKQEGKDLYIAHGKLWMPSVPFDNWVYHEFADNWYKMKRFYESYDFEWVRSRDASRWNETVAAVSAGQPLPDWSQE